MKKAFQNAILVAWIYIGVKYLLIMSGYIMTEYEKVCLWLLVYLVYLCSDGPQVWR